MNDFGNRVNTLNTIPERLNCPYCEKPFLSGAVTIDGDRYKCHQCNVWFCEIDGKFEKVKFIEVKK